MTQTAEDSRPDDPEPTIEVRDAPARRRFEIVVDGDVAGFALYREHGDRIAFTHTEVSDRYEGRGLAARLVASALDEVRARSKSVLPYCPYVRRYISRHPEYVDLVPLDVRAEFDLPTE